MKQSEVKALSVEDLQDKLMDIKKGYSDLKITHSVSPLDNPIQLRAMRRDVARLATEITKRGLQ